MALLAIRLFPDPILRKKSQPVFPGDLEIIEFIQNLTETLYAQPHGVGIAAPQVGKAKRIIVVDVSPRDPSRKREVMINPVLKKLEGEVLSREGCMSLPDYTANIKRATRVLVEWTDAWGRRRKKMTSGIEAICLQHEIDHLNGILYIDRVASLKTDVFPRKRRK